MTKSINYLFTKDDAKTLPNRWDIIALILVLSIITLIAWGAKQMTAPYQIGEKITISLDPHNLPLYALQTVLRMGIALIFSLLFTLIFGTWAAKSKRAGQIIIPMIDILQSVPVLAFLSITAVTFIGLFPGSLLGPECACIFVLFTAQAWNMALSFYQSLCTVPSDLKEAADMFHLSAWQRFWRIEVPFSMPSLLWNTMLSMSASWFSVVFSESISVANQSIALPGIGSYVAIAIEQADMHAVVYAILTMLLVIFLYDQLLFRPLLKWSEKFKFEHSPSDKFSHSWVIDLFRRTQLLRKCSLFFAICFDGIVNLPLFNRKHYRESIADNKSRHSLDLLWNLFILGVASSALFILWHISLSTIAFSEFCHVVFLGLITASRVLAILIICSLIWVPIGVWIGLRPRLAQIVQPIAQFLAAFPANLLFPIVVLLILKYHLNVEIWVTPLMILGTQWYVLFNVIAGASAIPKELNQATANLGVKGWLWWQRLILPAIFPYYITGAITAVGGAWNASIVAEVVNWGDTTLKATGLGAYIDDYSIAGDFPHLALGIMIMCLFVLALNRLIWRPLYRLAATRFQLD